MPSKHIHLPFPHKRAKDVDMTQGNITRHIIGFALPLLIGNLFQQLYNTVDTWVVGNFVSNEAFSAVGTVGPIINTMIGVFTGLSAGAGAVISQYYGAKHYDKVHDTVHTSIVMTLALSVMFTVVGIAVTPFMLRLMKMPPDVMPDAKLYLTIYFSGLIGLMLYNMGAGILRAIGDSQRPFYFLVACAAVNTGLDLLFVLVFHMGVDGVALATAISQVVSAILVVITLLRSKTCVKLILRDLKIDWQVLKKIVFVGIPAAIQMGITAFSNVFVQSYINFFGSDCMSGWTAYAKVDQLLFLPMQSIALAATTFVAQNLGSKQVDRAKKGVRNAILLAIASTVVLQIPVLIFAGPVVSFFNSKPEVVDYGAMLLRWLSPFYVLCCLNQIYTGALRGAGNSRAPMIIMLASFVLFRQVYLFTMSRVWNEIIPIAMCYPAGWFVCSAVNTVYYHSVRLDKHRIVEDDPREEAAQTT